MPGDVTELLFVSNKIAILSTSELLKYEETSFIEKRNKISNRRNFVCHMYPWDIKNKVWNVY